MVKNKLDFKELKKSNSLLIPVVSTYSETDLSGLLILNKNGDFTNVSLCNYPSINVFSSKKKSFYEKIDLYLIPKKSKLLFFSFIKGKLIFTFNKASFNSYPSFEEKFLNLFGNDNISKYIYFEEKEINFSESEFNELIKLVGEKKLLTLFNK